MKALELPFSGTVVSGLGEAAALYGVPTANLILESPLAMSIGVYVARVEIDERWHGAVVCIGADGNDKFEIHILDFPRKDILGWRLRGEVLAPISPMAPWKSVAQMRAKIAKDVAAADAAWRQICACVPEDADRTARFVALKGQPIHLGHCHLIRTMLAEAGPTDDLAIGIVHPFPFETPDMANNRRPQNFLPSKNPLTYLERAKLLQSFLCSIEGQLPSARRVVVAPYFLPTMFPLTQARNYLGLPPGAVEYVCDKDEFELGKELELNRIGVRVSFVKPSLDSDGKPYSADDLRGRIVAGVEVSEAIDPCIHRQMLGSGLYSAIRSRVELLTKAEI